MWGGARPHQHAWEEGARAPPKCHPNHRCLLYRKCAKIIIKTLETHQKNHFFWDELSKIKMEQLLAYLSISTTLWGS